MQAINRQPQRAPDGAPVHYERHRPEQTTQYRLVQQHAASFFEQAEAAAGADEPVRHVVVVALELDVVPITGEP